MSNLPAGSMRTRARVQRRTTAKGTRGESSEVWQDIGSVSCEVEYPTGRKLELARQLFARVSVIVKMRRPRAYTLTPRDRLIANSETLTLGAIVPKANAFDDLEVLCEVVQ
jgi:head-tail adaptor